MARAKNHNKKNPEVQKKKVLVLFPGRFVPGFRSAVEHIKLFLCRWDFCLKKVHLFPVTFMKCSCSLFSSASAAAPVAARAGHAGFGGEPCAVGVLQLVQLWAQGTSRRGVQASPRARAALRRPFVPSRPVNFIVCPCFI